MLGVRPKRITVERTISADDGLSSTTMVQIVTEMGNAGRKITSVLTGCWSQNFFIGSNPHPQHGTEEYLSV